MPFMTEERRMIQETAREFAMKEILPVANRLDKVQGDMPPELIAKIAELGYFGILIPEAYGGLGLGCAEYMIISEEFARAWMSVGSILARGNGLLPHYALTEAQREKYLPRVARGEFLCASANSEPNTGSDLASLTARAVRDGDGWRISGAKYWTTFADGADAILVLARTDPATDPKARHRGISAFLLEKPRGELPQNVKGTAINKIGYFGWKTWELALDNAYCPGENMIGEEGRGFYMFSRKMEIARAHTAARSIGLARGALEDAILFAQQRRQFGQTIGEFQAIRFKIAQMATEIEACRQLLFHVAEAVDSGERCDKEAAMIKYLAAEMSERVTSEGLQIHGGAGYTKDFPAERYWRDARLTKIFEGTSEIQLRIIADHLLGKPALAN